MNRQFTDDKKDIFELVSISDKYRIEGSSNISKLIFYGDVDLLDIAKSQTPKDILKHFIFVFKEVKKLDDVVITDFKCGKKNGVALRWTLDDLKKGYNKGVSFNDALMMESTIKLDVVADLDGRFLEITTVYDFGNNYVEISDNEFINNLIADYKEQMRNKNYFKALKRQFLIMKIKKEKQKLIKLFIDYFNQPVGLLYRLKSDLETTLLVMNKFPIADVKNNLDYIKEQISSFDITNYLIDIKKRRKTEIKKIIEKQLIAVQNELNRDVLHFIKQNKL
jgi:hypothetical protein